MNRRAWLLVLPLIGVVLCYGRALRGGFVFDDLDSVVRDPAARNLSVSSRLLLPSLLSAGRDLSNQAVASAHLGDYKSTGMAALTAQPRHPCALLVLGEIGIVRQDAAEAAYYLGLAVEAEPDEPVRLLEYGTALAKLGRPEEACRAWRSAMQSPRAREDDRKNAAQFSSALRCPTLGL